MNLKQKSSVHVSLSLHDTVIKISTDYKDED